MKTRFLSPSIYAFALLLSLAACGGDDDGDGDGNIDGGGDGAIDSGSGGDGADAATVDGYAPILTTSWTLPPPSSTTPDEYFCARLTMKEDVLLAGFRTISPNGTHHTVLSIGEPVQADTDFEPCGVGDNRTSLLYASGVGTDDFDFPEGVGLRIEAGQQLNLNVHTFNATDFDLSGTSGVAVKLVEAVEEEAQFNLVGPIGFSVEADGAEHEVSGSCSVSQDATVLNWWPHMHKLGVHQIIEVEGEVVHDQPFNFLEQVNYPTNRQLSAGDSITVTCRHLNDTGEDVGFGESSNQEMCFAGFYRYPKAVEDEGFCFGFGEF
jgi:hypothetical protein